MGKLTYLILMLVMIDLMFFVFIDTPAASLNSAVFKSITVVAEGGGWENVKSLFTFNWITIILSLATLAVAAAGITLKFLGISSNTETYIWATVAGLFVYGMGADYLHIFKVLAGIAGPTAATSGPLRFYVALFLMLPIIILFIWTIIEWIRGKD